MPHSPQASSAANPNLPDHNGKLQPTRAGFGFQVDPLMYEVTHQAKPFRATMERSVVRIVANWPQGFEGRGCEKYESGEMYVGEIMDGQRGGRGCFKHANGQTLVSAWRGNAPTGEGVQWDETGEKAARMQDGRPVENIDFATAGAISKRLGVPPPYEFGVKAPPPKELSPEADAYQTGKPPQC
mmetsp:Transcript_68771/g.136286  ORF Transcript_68771/g.136286 Transcript_68771/m.136286 type:complete len:184 (-) Transcript_68771:211-762(-)